MNSYIMYIITFIKQYFLIILLINTFFLISIYSNYEILLNHIFQSLQATYKLHIVYEVYVNDNHSFIFIDNSDKQFFNIPIIEISIPLFNDNHFYFENYMKYISLFNYPIILCTVLIFTKNKLYSYEYNLLLLKIVLLMCIFFLQNVYFNNVLITQVLYYYNIQYQEYYNISLDIDYNINFYLRLYLNNNICLIIINIILFVITNKLLDYKINIRGLILLVMLIIITNIIYISDIILLSVYLSCTFLITESFYILYYILYYIIKYIASF